MLRPTDEVAHAHIQRVAVERTRNVTHDHRN
jgi:hypothetical protein